MERLNGRLSILVSAVAVVAVLLIGWFGFVAPQREKTRELESQIHQTELSLRAAEALVAGSAREQSTEELATLRTAIPDEVGMPQIIRQLSAASAGARVRITAITPRPVVSSGVADAIPLSLSVEGDYFAIREFLRLLRTRAALNGDELQATGRLFSADSVQFAGAAGEGGFLSAALEITSYAFRGAAPAPGAATQAPADDTSAEASG